MEEKNVALKPCLSHFVGMETAPFKLASHRSSGGRGTTKWWKGAAEGGIIKNCGEAATTTLGLKGRQT